MVIIIIIKGRCVQHGRTGTPVVVVRSHLPSSSQPKLLDIIVQELCESRGGRPELSVLTSLLVSVDVKNY